MLVGRRSLLEADAHASANVASGRAVAGWGACARSYTGPGEADAKLGDLFERRDVLYL